jgi:hypothetical protein
MPACVRVAVGEIVLQIADAKGVVRVDPFPLVN